MESVNKLLKKYISERIPKKATNIFFQMFNGIDAAFMNMDFKLNVLRRERNILTAQHLGSLRNHAAKNGFEPKLKIPSTGLLKLEVNPKLFNAKGYPLFVPAYSVFTCVETRLEYVYISNKTFRIDSNVVYLPVSEGKIVTDKVTGDGKKISRYYLNEENVANDSIVVEVNGERLKQVQSFFDSEGENNDRQFLVKFSNDIQRPLIVYVKGLQYNEKANITYQLTTGELGNITDMNYSFETDDIIDTQGESVDIDDSDMVITNFSGFDLGSNGTDENALRAAIGYNHGSELLYDNISYRNFLSKYSTIVIQDVKHGPSKSINNIFVSRKQSINTKINDYQQIINQYKQILLTGSYMLSKETKQHLSEVMDEFEYALSSHNIYDSLVNKFALQIEFDLVEDKENLSDELLKLIYIEFGKFLYDKSYILDLEKVFSEFMSEYNCFFEFMVFNENNERDKIAGKNVETPTSYIIKHDNYLPILKGDFNIVDSDSNKFQLFFDVNIVSKAN